MVSLLGRIVGRLKATLGAADTAHAGTGAQGSAATILRGAGPPEVLEPPIDSFAASKAIIRAQQSRVAVQVLLTEVHAAIAQLQSAEAGELRPTPPLLARLAYLQQRLVTAAATVTAGRADLQGQIAQMTRQISSQDRAARRQDPRAGTPTGTDGTPPPGSGRAELGAQVRGLQNQLTKLDYCQQQLHDAGERLTARRTHYR